MNRTTDSFDDFQPSSNHRFLVILKHSNLRKTLCDFKDKYFLGLCLPWFRKSHAPVMGCCSFCLSYIPQILFFKNVYYLKVSWCRLWRNGAMDLCPSTDSAKLFTCANVFFGHLRRNRTGIKLSLSCSVALSQMSHTENFVLNPPICLSFSRSCTIQ